MGLVRVNLRRMVLTHAGVGNTRAILLRQQDSSRTTLSSTRGIVGAGYERLRPETFSFKSGDVLLLYTDGLPQRIDAAALTRDRNRHPKQIAEEALVRWARDTDDAAVLVARMESPE